MISEGLTVFFPVHNEIGNLEPLVRSTVELLPDLTPDPELIIVDDGSTDGSGELADALSAEIDFVRALHHERNLGYGAALRSGFQAATKEYVFYTDGDAQFDIRQLREILPLASQADVISCFRVNRQDPWHRLLNTRLFEIMVFLVFHLRVRDPDCAFKIYRREVLDAIVMESTGAMIDVEMLLRAKRNGFKILQKGVRHYPRQSGASSGGNPRVIAKALFEALKLWWNVIGKSWLPGR